MHEECYFELFHGASIDHCTESTSEYLSISYDEFDLYIILLIVTYILFEILRGRSGKEGHNEHEGDRL